KFDLTLTLLEGGGALAGVLEYNSDLFDAATVDRLLGHFQRLLEGSAAAPDRPVLQVPLLDDAERRQVLVAWNAPATDHPPGLLLHELVEAQVERTPDAVAVVSEDERLTYRELDERANRLGHHLRTLGVGPEVIVGVCLERSAELVVALLGVLKAGAAY